MATPKELLNNEVYVGPTQPSGHEKVWIKKGKNLFNKKTVSSGYISSTGAIVTGSNNEISSEYIEIEKGQDYTFSVIDWTGEQMWCAISLYDENKTFIERWDAYNTSITAPATATQNAKYVRTSNRYNNNNIKIMLEQGSVATTYEPYIEKEIYCKNSNGVWEKFEQIEDTGWRDLTILNGIAYSDEQIPQIRRIGKQVQIRGALKGITAQETYLVQIPSDCIPSQTHSFVCPGSGSRHNRFQLDKNNGKLAFNNTSSTETLTENNWYPICTSYFVD